MLRTTHWWSTWPSGSKRTNTTPKAYSIFQKFYMRFNSYTSSLVFKLAIFSEKHMEIQKVKNCLAARIERGFCDMKTASQIDRFMADKFHE